MGYLEVWCDGWRVASFQTGTYAERRDAAMRHARAFYPPAIGADPGAAREVWDVYGSGHARRLAIIRGR